MSDVVEYSHESDVTRYSLRNRKKYPYSNFIEGLAALIVLDERVVRYHGRKAESDTDALCNDFKRIGADMWNIIEREKVNEKIKESKKG